MSQLPDLDQLRLNGHAVDARPIKTVRSGRFLKGPVPWDWITRAASLPGKALHVGTAVWLWAGIKKTKREIPLSLTRTARDFGFDHSTASRALAALERAGLVTVTRSSGRKVIVSIRLQAHEEDPGA